MNLDSLIAELQAIRTDDGRGLLPVTATAPGLRELRPVSDVAYHEYDGACRVSLTVDDSEGA